MSQDRVILFANGHVPDYSRAIDLINANDYFIAANGGSLHALAMQIRPHVVVGDFDSLPESKIHELTMMGTIFWRFPVAKDETDLELAIRYAVEAGYKRLLIIGALGGRVDQALGNLSTMASPSLEDLDVRFDDGVEEAFFIRKKAEVCGEPGDTISLIPWGNQVDGITTENLRYPLNDETLYPDRSRGISNEMLADIATVVVKSGLLLCIHRRKEKE